MPHLILHHSQVIFRMRRTLTAFLVVLVPIFLGLGVSLLLQAGLAPNYLFVGQYRADLAALVSLGGLVLGVLIASVFGLRAWANGRLARARAAEQCAEAEARRRFFQRLDHELKNPLTVIRLGLTNLLQQPALHADPSLTRIEQQTQRLQKLVKDLRALSELEEREIERGPVPLAEALAEAVELAHSAPDRADREVEVNVQQVPWPLPPVLGDRDLLLVLFSNLLDNAFKFTRAGGRVEVRATEDAHTAVIEVADNGLGIPAADLGHIFEELYRAENARETAGSGLGLALVQRIVALHQGSIVVRSRPEQGTVVTVRLPLSGAP
jgi:two-component system OmpR family sensor kinase